MYLVILSVVYLEIFIRVPFTVRFLLIGCLKFALLVGFLPIITIVRHLCVHIYVNSSFS